VKLTGSLRTLLGDPQSGVEVEVDRWKQLEQWGQLDQWKQLREVCREETASLIGLMKE